MGFVSKFLFTQIGSFKCTCYIFFVNTSSMYIVYRCVWCLRVFMKLRVNMPYDVFKPGGQIILLGGTFLFLSITM